MTEISPNIFKYTLIAALCLTAIIYFVLIAYSLSGKSRLDASLKNHTKSYSNLPMIVFCLSQLAILFILDTISLRYKLFDIKILLCCMLSNIFSVFTVIRFGFNIRNQIEQANESVYIEQQLGFIEEQNKERAVQKETMDSIKADISKHMEILKDFDKRQDFKGLDKYMSGINDYVSVTISQTEFCKRPALNATLFYLNNMARAKGIDVEFAVNSVEKLNISDIYLCTVISNLVENAIEAADKCSTDKFVRLKTGTVKKNFIIKTENSVPNDIDENLKTTKSDKENHGLGLSIVKNILDEYDGKIEFSFNDNLVICIASIRLHD